MKKRIAGGIAFACAVVAVVAMIIAGGVRSEDKTPDGITIFENYSQIQKALDEVGEQFNPVYLMEDSATGAESGKQSSETYVQVEGVDEADEVKTDGNYIYYTSRESCDVIITKAEEGETSEAAVITEEESGTAVQELYLTGDMLVTIGTVSDSDTDKPVMYNMNRPIVTAVNIYDISDPEKPKRVSQYKQTGYCVSSRIADGYIYLITNDYIYDGTDRIVPMAGCGDAYEKLAPEAVCAFPDPSCRGYVVMGAIEADPAGTEAKSRTRALLGASDDLYCSGENIYLTDHTIDYEMGPSQDTTIIKASMRKGRTEFVAKGSVRGNVINQFAMDEEDGFLRVAATAWVNDKQVNYLYVLDEELNTAGKLKGFAVDEEIRAVKYIGDKAYVITYEQTDPLFVIDLEDPEDPKILGSVEITGFSSLLVPEGENRLLGIGYSTSEGEMGEVTDGIKIALFDISDPSAPKVLDSMEYEGYSSEAQYDHKALTLNDEEGWYAIPYEIWNGESSGGVLKFSVSGGELTEDDDFGAETGINRCVYIGDYIYGLNRENNEVQSWNYKK